jgi:hypothetical protein
MDRQKDGQTEGWTDRRMDRQKERLKYGKIEGGTEQMDRQNR